MSVDLVRRWAEDWLGNADASVAPEILGEEYTLHIGGFELGPRDTYVAAVVSQLFEKWPGLKITVNELIFNGERVAARLTQSGADARSGAEAAWPIVTLFFAPADGKLTGGWAEEDYLSRTQQVKSGEPAPIPAAAPDPWNTPAVPADDEAEAVVRAWLEAQDMQVDDLFSAGPRVAFHAVRREEPPLPVAGFVTVQDGAVTETDMVADLMGQQRAAAQR